MQLQCQLIDRDAKLREYRSDTGIADSRPSLSATKPSKKTGCDSTIYDREADLLSRGSPLRPSPFPSSLGFKANAAVGW